MCLHQKVLVAVLAVVAAGGGSGCAGEAGVFLNGDFETGTLKFWNADSGATIVEDGDEAHAHGQGVTHDHDGSRSGQYGATGSLGMVLAQSVANRLEAGATYEFSAWVKVTMADSGHGAPTLRVSRDAQLAGGVLGEVRAQNVVALGWQRVAFSIEVTEESLAQPIYAGVTNVGFGGVAVADDFRADLEHPADEIRAL